MADSAHGYTIKCPALLNDTRNLISQSTTANRYALSAISFSISALEAFLNEIAQLGNGYKAHNHGLENPLVCMAIALDGAESQRKPTVTKLEIAYKSLIGKNVKFSDFSSFQKLKIAIDVRNELAHPKSSTLTISSTGLSLQLHEQKLVKKLRSNGFKVSNDPFDWERAVNTKEFALWVYQAVISTISLVFDAWPYANAIDSFKEIYSLNLSQPESWEQFT